jgi:hypothetical protein
MHHISVSALSDLVLSLPCLLLFGLLARSAHFALQHPRGIAFPIIVRGPDFPAGYPFAAQLAAARDVIMMIADFCPYAADLGDQSNPTCDGRNVAAYLDSKFAANASSGARDCVPTATATDVLFQRLLVNGRAADAPLVQPMPLNSVVRLRAINAAAMSHVVLRFPPGATVYIVAVDGVATQPQLVTGNFWLGTAQRADFFFELNNVDAAVGFPVLALTEASDVAVDGVGFGLQAVLLLHTAEQGLPAQRSWPLTFEATPAWPLPGFMAAATELTLRAYVSLPNPLRLPDRSYQVDLTGAARVMEK